MSDSIREEDSPRESGERRENQCNALHTLHTLHKQEKNYQIQVRMKQSAHKAFMRYCALAGMTAGTFYEKAGVMFMDLNPVDGAVIVIERPVTRDLSMKDRVLTLMCVQEFEALLPTLKRMKEKGVSFNKKFLTKINRMFDKYFKISSPGDEVKELAEEVLTYLD